MTTTERRRVAVVMPALDVADVIGDQLAALERQDFRGDMEIIVADNGSSDETRTEVQWWQRRLSNLTLVDASERRGAAFARNRGVEATQARLIVFCDADDVVHPSWLRHLTAALDHADVAIGYTLSKDFQHPPVEMDLDRLFGQKPHRSPSLRTDLTPVTSCNLGVRREAFEAVDGFDEGLLLGHDQDLGFRLQLAGYEIVWVPEAMVLRRKPQAFWPLLKKGLRGGRYRHVLLTRYGPAGASFTRTARSLRSWWWVFSRLPLLPFNRTRRSHWAQAAGGLVGELLEMSKHLRIGSFVARKLRTVLSLLSRHEEPVFDGVRAYWEARHQRHGTRLSGVGRVGLPEDANALHYQIKKARVRRVLESLHSEHATLLDAGSGTGVFSQLATDIGFDVTAIDFSWTALTNARKRTPNVTRWVAGNLTSLPLRSTFDVVICVDVLFHIIDDGGWREALRNLGAAVASQGALVLQEQGADTGAAGDGAPHVRWRSLADYETVLWGWRLAGHERYRLPYSGEHKDLLVYMRGA